MLEDALGKPSPIARSLASTTKDHASQLIAQTLCRVRVSFITESLGEIEELLLLSLLGFNPILDQLNQHASCAEPPGFCHRAHLRGYFGRQTHALTHCSWIRSHCTIMHHSDAARHSPLTRCKSHESMVPKRGPPPCLDSLAPRRLQILAILFVIVVGCQWRLLLPRLMDDAHHRATTPAAKASTGVV